MSTIDQERAAARSDVVRAWVDGWAVARSVPAPIAVDGGFRLDVGLPGHLVRYVLFDVDAVAELALTRAEPGTWIKTAAPAEQVRSALTPTWTEGAPEYLMTTPLRRTRATAPAGYTIDVETRGGLTSACLLAADRTVAARGRVAVTGSTAVVDDVLTDPAHRRRGLGSVLMTRLADAAAEQGATTGVLVASPAGRELYRTLGWTLRSEITPAWIPTPDPDPIADPEAADA
ncbi:GNAT family N-acetyltransferase [Embleya sp. NBC_00896]|uniref:GNAT family N-acetyltransferase n=1 Tax=Embleya sp. NBC_00896 TaxID=2975961 RepID=UPI00386F264A|nr:GNAT family N-acetyltransferase [Embleya sp. NBC_00896]